MRDPYAPPITKIKEFKINHALLQSRIAELENLSILQCSEGNWNYDPYSHGIANGIILALATLKSEEPIFLEPPEEWLNETYGDKIRETFRS